MFQVNPLISEAALHLRRDTVRNLMQKHIQIILELLVEQNGIGFHFPLPGLAFIDELVALVKHSIAVVLLHHFTVNVLDGHFFKFGVFGLEVVEHLLRTILLTLFGFHLIIKELAWLDYLIHRWRAQN